MSHVHLTWPLLLQILYRLEEPGRWWRDLSLVLMETCSTCRANCADLVEMLDAGEIPDNAGYYDLALLRSRRRARAAWEDLKDRSPEMLTQILKRTPPSYGMVDRLVEESHQQASMDRDLAHRFAEAALQMAQRLPVRLPDDRTLVGPDDEEPLDPPVKAEMLALAHGVLGNAYRKHYRFQEAAAAFDAAHAYLEEAEAGTCLLHARARVLSLQGSLLMDTRRFSEAIQDLEAASEAAAADEKAPVALRAEIAIKQSLVLGLDGQDMEAIRPIRDLLTTPQPNFSLRLQFHLRHRLAEQLVYAGKSALARAELADVQELARIGGRGFDALRARWLEGRILCAEFHQQEALDIFKALQEEFMGKGAIHEAALLALEIAGVLLALNRPTETAVHARQAVVLFLPLQLSKETHSALALLAQSAERQSASQNLIAALLRYAQGGPLPAPLLWL